MMKKVVTVLLSSAVLAASSLVLVQQEIVAEETVQTVALSPKVGKELLRLQELAQAKQCASALGSAQNMLSWKNLSGYEKVQIYNFMGYCHYSTDNLRASAEAYENVLAQGADAPLGIQQSILQTISSIYLQQENYNKALDSISRLMRIVPDPTAELWVLKGQAHYQAGQYGQVIDPINRAIQMYRSQGKPPKENWLLMSRHAAYEQGDYKAMSGFIRELIRYYPKESYISQLAGAYSQAGDNRKFLVLTEILYEGGYKTDASTIKNLSQLYLMEEVPYKAAKLLEKTMSSGATPNNLENKKLLATSWFQARADKKAIPVLKEAADQSRDPELYIRLAQSSMNVDNWDGCVSASKNALNNGVKNRKAANTMMGMCYLNQEKLDDARAAFVSAGGAKNWLNYIDNELKRKQKLEQDIDIKKIEKNELLESIETG